MDFSNNFSSCNAGRMHAQVSDPSNICKVHTGGKRKWLGLLVVGCGLCGSMQLIPSFRVFYGKRPLIDEKYHRPPSTALRQIWMCYSTSFEMDLAQNHEVRPEFIVIFHRLDSPVRGGPLVELFRSYHADKRCVSVNSSLLTRYHAIACVHV